MRFGASERFRAKQQSLGARKKSDFGVWQRAKSCDRDTMATRVYTSSKRQWEKFLRPFWREALLVQQNRRPWRRSQRWEAWSIVDSQLLGSLRRRRPNEHGSAQTTAHDRLFCWACQMPLAASRTQNFSVQRSGADRICRQRADCAVLTLFSRVRCNLRMRTPPFAHARRGSCTCSW
jgi:hypothetical protein